MARTTKAKQQQQQSGNVGDAIKDAAVQKHIDALEQEQKKHEQAQRVALNDVQHKLAMEVAEALGQREAGALNWAQSMRNAGLALLDMTQEGYVGIPSPLQACFIDTLIKQALHVAYPGQKVKMQETGSIKNAQTGLYRIAEAATLDGYLADKDGENVPVRSILKSRLQADLGRSFNKGGFNPARSEAMRILKMMKERAAADKEFAGLLSEGAIKDSTKPQAGRTAKAPSDAAMSEIVDKVKLMQNEQIKNLLLAARERMLAAVPTIGGDNPDIARKQTTIIAKIRQGFEVLLNEAYESLEKLRGELNAPRPKADVDRAIAGMGGKTPTHTDEVTARRAASKTAAKAPSKRASKNAEQRATA